MSKNNYYHYQYDKTEFMNGGGGGVAGGPLLIPRYRSKILRLEHVCQWPYLTLNLFSLPSIKFSLMFVFFLI